MKKIVSIIFVLIFIYVNAEVVRAQTLHTIIACNTIDSSIGTGMISDMMNMRNASQIIAANLGCEYDEYVFDGPQCTKANIIKCIDNMEIGRDDVVMFFYGGHGTHAENNSEDPWPQMCMNTNIESLFFPVASLDKIIANKQPKLRIILTNCCNKEQSGVSIKPLYAQSSGATMLSGYNAEAFKKLFLENKGKVIMTSSKLGQYSWCGANGGLFTNYLIDVFDAVGTDKISPTWDAVCKSTHDKTLSCNNLPGGAKQEPYYKVSVNKKGIDGGDGGTVPPTSKNPENLFTALQSLLDHSISKPLRLSKMSEILDKYFSTDAHVVTVGRNGTSKIMYEEIADFLRRLALSDNIKQVNILEGKDDLKNELITVHEIRY